MIRVRPVTLAQANAMIERLHRHHKRVQGHRFSVSAWDGDRLCGVAVVGRPVARMTDQETIAEVTRLCTDGTRNACSALYAACARAAAGMGFREIQTFILESEPGTSLRASGWELASVTDGGSWSRPSRGRTDEAPTCPKQKWRKVLNP